MQEQCETRGTDCAYDTHHQRGCSAQLSSSIHPPTRMNKTKRNATQYITAQQKVKRNVPCWYLDDTVSPVYSTPSSPFPCRRNDPLPKVRKDRACLWTKRTSRPQSSCGCAGGAGWAACESYSHRRQRTDSLESSSSSSYAGTGFCNYTELLWKTRTVQLYSPTTRAHAVASWAGKNVPTPFSKQHWTP
jgi:hypothetical protein